jgi:aldehyde:ferredoxin oxidoreductase
MWGGEDAFNMLSYRGKALASKKIQDYGYAKESIILCDLAWPIYQVHPSADNTAPFALESRMVSAVTGKKIDEAELEKTGERNFNMQRAVLIRQGWGGRDGDNIMGYLFQEPFPGSFFNPRSLVPDSSGRPVSRAGAMMEKSGFEQLKDEYYTLRGWDVATGQQTIAKLQELGLGDIARELETIELVV